MDANCKRRRKKPSGNVLQLFLYLCNFTSLTYLLNLVLIQPGITFVFGCLIGWWIDSWYFFRVFKMRYEIEKTQVLYFWKLKRWFLNPCNNPKRQRIEALAFTNSTSLALNIWMAFHGKLSNRIESLQHWNPQNLRNQDWELFQGNWMWQRWKIIFTASIFRFLASIGFIREMSVLWIFLTTAPALKLVEKVSNQKLNSLVGRVDDGEQSDNFLNFVGNWTSTREVWEKLLPSVLFPELVYWKSRCSTNFARKGGPLVRKVTKLWTFSVPPSAPGKKQKVVPKWFWIQMILNNIFHLSYFGFNDDLERYVCGTRDWKSRCNFCAGGHQKISAGGQQKYSQAGRKINLKVTWSTSKYREVSQRTKKYLKVPGST